MKIPFTKMSGAGNDFIVIDNRSGIINAYDVFSRHACNRRFGIGADGVLLVEASEKSGFTMKYYNADGSNAGMCGNGGRCISKFAFDNAIVMAERFTFDAFGHMYEAVRLGPDLFELKMKDPSDLRLNQTLEEFEPTLLANYLNTGTDHSVIFLDDNAFLGLLDATEVVSIGRKIRYCNTYQPKGVNVNFVSRFDTNSIEIRTYERGVEDETLACGTGSVASALLSSLKFGLTSPIKVKVRSGEFLEISFNRSNNNFSNIYLKGSAIVTFKGEFDF